MSSLDWVLPILSDFYRILGSRYPQSPVEQGETCIAAMQHYDDRNCSMLNPTSPLSRGEEVIVQLKNVLSCVFRTLNRAEGEMGDFLRTLAADRTLVLQDSGLTT
jgi:hypothetical protein